MSIWILYNTSGSTMSTVNRNFFELPPCARMPDKSLYWCHGPGLPLHVSAISRYIDGEPTAQTACSTSFAETYMCTGLAEKTTEGASVLALIWSWWQLCRVPLSGALWQFQRVWCRLQNSAVAYLHPLTVSSRSTTCGTSDLGQNIERV